MRTTEREVADDSPPGHSHDYTDMIQVLTGTAYKNDHSLHLFFFFAAILGSRKRLPTEAVTLFVLPLSWWHEFGRCRMTDLFTKLLCCAPKLLCCTPPLFTFVPIDVYSMSARVFPGTELSGSVQVQTQKSSGAGMRLSDHMM